MTAADGLDLAPEEMIRLARERYGLEVRSATRLGSERSTVARLEVGTRVVVLKAERSSPDELALARWRVAAMRRLEERGLPVPRTVPDRGGQEVPVARTTAGPVLLHLAEALPGIPLEEAPSTRALLADVGRTAARVAAGLADVPAPPRPVTHPWELVRTLSTLEETTPAVADPVVRRLVAAAADLFRRDVEPRLPGLPRAVVHHDLHDSNLLVDPVAGRVTGVLDLGDLVVGPRVAELAVAAAYASRNAADPVGALLDVAGGWGALLPLRADEVAVVPAAAAGRLAVNVAVWAGRLHGSRSDYARSRSARSAAALEALLAADAGAVRSALHDRLTPARSGSVPLDAARSGQDPEQAEG